MALYCGITMHSGLCVVMSAQQGLANHSHVGFNLHLRSEPDWQIIPMLALICTYVVNRMTHGLAWACSQILNQ